MISRIAWIAGLVALAALTALLQIDRQSERTPSLASVVPAPLRSDAQLRIAAQAVEGDDAERGLAEATALVKRRPVPAEHLTLLAVAQAKAGQLEQSGVTIQIAGQRGWRDPLAQETVLRIALAAGDKAEAARRYAALFLRSRTPNALLEELGPAVLGEPGGAGQQTLTAIVIGGERWRPTFLRRGLQVMPADAFAAMTAASLKGGATFDCTQLQQAIIGLARHDAAAGEIVASAARESSCPQVAPAA
jgi:hypothetical protein